MKRIFGRWPILIVVGGGLLILFFFIEQSGNKDQGRGSSETGMALNETVTAVAPTSTPTFATVTTRTAVPLIPTLPNTAAPEATTDPQPTATVVFLTETPALMATAVPLIPTLPKTATPVATIDPQPTATEVFLTETPASPLTVCTSELCVPRFGASGEIGIMAEAYEAGLPFGHYLDWELESNPLQIGEAAYWQMVRVSEDGIRHEWSEVSESVAANPGGIWIVGNEPDIVWQDNTSAEQFAAAYHDVYTFIKAQDPTALIAVGGVGQPTPLRLAYLDVVLETYAELYDQSMPVDIWTIHNFILREERDSWGVGIPPGMVGPSGELIDEGTLYEIPDHSNLAIFEENLIDFRQWMAERGYRERPLAVTEFGILMPSDFGFPPAVVAEFLVGSFEFLMTATDDSIGYPADDNHLVQWSFWYSVYDDDEFPTGNLYDPETAALTPLGELYANFIEGN